MGAEKYKNMEEACSKRKYFRNDGSIVVSAMVFIIYVACFGMFLVDCETISLRDNIHVRGHNLIGKYSLSSSSSSSFSSLPFLANNRKQQFWDKELSLLLRGGADETDSSSAPDVTKEKDDEKSTYFKVTKVADLTSIISEVEENEEEQGEEATEAQEEASPTKPVEGKEEFVFAASMFGDGSEKDPDGLPDRYLRMAKGDRAKAKKAFENTLEWRKEHNVDSILKRAHPKFDLCRRVFPVFLLGRDEKNNVVVIQRPGLIDFDYGKPFGFSLDDLLMHYVFMCEYLWNILENNSESSGVMTTIIDLKNIGWSTFANKDKRQFVMKFVSMMSEHYPQRSFKTLIINVPHWSNLPWKAVRPILRESTRKKIQLISASKHQDAILRSVLGENNVPPELLHNYIPDSDGKTDTSSLVKSNLDNDLRLFCLDRLKDNGESMIELV